MLFQHVMKHDYDSARKLYEEALRLMTKRGPDLPIILYGYAIFLCATGEEDWGTISELIWRARQADTDGESFRFAVSYNLPFQNNHALNDTTISVCLFVYIVSWILQTIRYVGTK